MGGYACRLVARSPRQRRAPVDDECVDCYNAGPSTVIKMAHCSHCKGLPGACGCKSGCARVMDARCYVKHDHPLDPRTLAGAAPERYCGLCFSGILHGDKYFTCSRCEYDECQACKM